MVTNLHEVKSTQDPQKPQEIDLAANSIKDTTVRDKAASIPSGSENTYWGKLLPTGPWTFSDRRESQKK